MQTNDRNVASFIQDMLHLKPHEERELQHPLAFLLPPHDVKVGLTPSGQVLNDALQGYKRGLLGNLTEKIANRDQMVQRFRGHDILVVVSDSGTGKTFLLARTVALLLNKRRGEGQQNLVPNLAFSQLKSRQHRHQRHNNLVDAVLSSTHLSSAPNDIDAFREGVGVERMQPGQQPTVPDIIMFIDSLDEVEKKLQSQLHEADRRLREKGILPIWAMRRLEFAHLESKIEQLDVENLINTDGASNQIAIELDLTSDLETEIKQLLHGHQHVVNADEETQRAIEEYLKTALSKYQLLHKPRTHLASNLSNDGRKHLFLSLLNGLIEGYFQISADFDGRFPRDPHAWKSIYGQDPNLQNQLYKSNLCFRIIDRFLEELKEKIDWFSVALNEFYRLLSKHFIRALNSESDIVSDIIPGEVVSKCSKLLQHFWKLGLIVGNPEQAGPYQFAHRDITAAFCLNSLSPEELRDVEARLKHNSMFSPFIPHDSRSRNAMDVVDFHRRNGDVLKYIPPLLIEKKKGISAAALPPPWKGLTLEQTTYEKYGDDLGLSETQRKISEDATQIYAKQCVPLIIHGPPGTGKTWLAVERMLGTTHMVSNLPGFIVTLNATLARAHLMDLEEQHSDGVVMREWDYEQRVKFIVDRIRVEGLQEILIDLTSENEEVDVLTSKDLATQWKITCDAVMNNREVRNAGNLHVHYNRAVFDYRNLMFNQFGPQLNSCEEWRANAEERAKESLWHTPGLDEEVKKILCETWRDRIHQQISRAESKKTSLTSIAATTVQRMLAHELRSKLPDLTAQELIEAGFDLGWDVNELDGRLDEFGRRLGGLGPAGSMVIDEVQDMTPIEVVVLTLLVEFEEHESHRIMLAGDEYQTINGNDFAWDPWLYRLQALCRSLLDMVQRVYNKKSRNMGWHRLESLASLRGMALTPPLTEVRRNKAEIVEFFTEAWEWDLAPWESNETIAKTTPYRTKEIEPEEDSIELLHVELSVDRESTLDELVGFIKGLSGRGNLSVIIPDGGLRDVLLEKLVSDNDSELFIYDPFTIKGLEQDVAVVIGGYAASNESEFSMLLSTHHDAERDLSTRNLFDRINRYMLVSNSRARNTLITVSFEVGHSEFSQQLRWRQFPPPRVVSENVRQDLGLDDVLTKLDHRPEEWAVRSFAELQKLVNRGEEDARYEEQIDRVRVAWLNRAKDELKRDNLLNKLLYDLGVPKTETLGDHVPLFAAKFLGKEANDELGQMLSLVKAHEEEKKKAEGKGGVGTFFITDLSDYLDLRNGLKAKLADIEKLTKEKSEEGSLAHSKGGRFSSETRLLRLQTDILKEFTYALSENRLVLDAGLLRGRDDDDFATRWVSTRKILPARLDSNDVKTLARYFFAALQRNPNSDVLAENVKDMMSQSVASLRIHHTSKQSKSQPKTENIVAVCWFAKQLLSGDSRLKLQESSEFERDVFEFHSYAGHQSNVHPFGWWEFVESEIKSEGWNAILFSKVRRLFEGKDTNVRMQIIRDVPYWRKKPHIVALAVDPDAQLVGSSLIQSTKDAQDMAKDALGKLLLGAMDTSAEWLGHSTAMWEDLLGEVGRILLHASDPPQLSNIVGIFTGHHSISVKGEQDSTIDVTERLRFAASMLAMNFLKEKIPRRSERSKIAPAYSIPDLLEFVEDGRTDSVDGLLQQLLEDLKSAKCEVNQDIFRTRGLERKRFSWQPIFMHVRNVFITQLLERHNIHCTAEPPVRSEYSSWLAQWLPSSIDASGVAWPDLDEEALQSTVGFEYVANRFHAENLLRDRLPVAVHDKMYIGNPIQFGKFTAPRHVAPLLEQQKESFWVNDRLYLTVTDPRVEKWIHTVADLLVIGIEDDTFRNNWGSLWTFLLENGAFEQFGRGRKDGDVDSVSIAFTEEAVQKARQIGQQSLFDVYPGTAAFSPLDHVALPDWFRRHPTIINVVKFEGTGTDAILKRL